MHSQQRHKDGFKAELLRTDLIRAEQADLSLVQLLSYEAEYYVLTHTSDPPERAHLRPAAAVAQTAEVKSD